MYAYQHLQQLRGDERMPVSRLRAYRLLLLKLAPLLVLPPSFLVDDGWCRVIGGRVGPFERALVGGHAEGKGSKEEVVGGEESKISEKS
jgi:hypothetical protein